MTRFPYVPLCLLLITSFFAGCVLPSSEPVGDFVTSIDFTPLNTFSYKHTLVSGANVRESERMFMRSLSKEVLTEEMIARDFALEPAGSDFYVVTKWRKSSSSDSNMSGVFGGGYNGGSYNEVPTTRMPTLYTVIVEVYKSGTDQLFWRAELPNIFDRMQFSEVSIRAALERAIEGFPNRVPKDPDLPNIQ